MDEIVRNLQALEAELNDGIPMDRVALVAEYLRRNDRVVEAEDIQRKGLPSRQAAVSGSMSRNQRLNLWRESGDPERVFLAEVVDPKPSRGTLQRSLYKLVSLHVAGGLTPQQAGWEVEKSGEFDHSEALSAYKRVRENWAKAVQAIMDTQAVSEDVAVFLLPPDDHFPDLPERALDAWREFSTVQTPKP